MPTPRPVIATTLATFICLCHTVAQQPGTALHQSGIVIGGTGWDEPSTMRAGPGSWLTVVGHTDSPGLATPGAWQPALQGGFDLFVARFDRSLPAGQQLVWLTYVGGNDMDLALDAQVDHVGTTTIVGLTRSSNFPMNATIPGFQVSPNGTSDAFVIQLDAAGSLRYATYFGGASDDRGCVLALSANGAITLAGVTESQDLPTLNAPNPTYLGGLTDAFVARIDPLSPPSTQLTWSTYLGGPSFDGARFGVWINSGGLAWGLWHLKRQGIAVLPNGTVAIATNSYAGALTTGGCYQPTNAGAGDAYLTLLDTSAPSVTMPYATYFGGNDEDRVHALAPHPEGGFVLAGSTFSTNLPTTPGAFQPTQHGGSPDAEDAFVAWLDPAISSSSGQLEYASYFGGSGGDDRFLAVAIESSGLVTLTGSGSDGGAIAFPTTPGCHQASSSAVGRKGAIAHMLLKGQGAADLVYGTLVAQSDTRFHGIVLDDVGDPFVVGSTSDPAYPIAGSPSQFGGTRDVVLSHLPLLAGGSERQQLPFATAACASRLYSGALGAPSAGNNAFAACATNAPPISFGTIAFGTAPLVPTIVLNCWLLVTEPLLGGPILGDVVPSNSLGFARHALAIPVSLPPGTVVYLQWAFLTNANCPGSGPFGTSERLRITTL